MTGWLIVEMFPPISILSGISVISIFTVEQRRIMPSTLFQTAQHSIFTCLRIPFSCRPRKVYFLVGAVFVFWLPVVALIAV